MKNEIRHTKITCKHCGCIIDLDVKNICPNCGAVCESSEHIQQYNTMQDKMNRLKIDTAEAELEGIRLDNAEKRQKLNKYNTWTRTKTSAKKKFGIIKRILLAWVTIFTGLMLAGVIGIFTSGEWLDMIEEESYTPPVVEVEPEIVEQPIEVGFNTNAELIQYCVVCDKAEEYFYPWTKPTEGNYYLRLHLIVTNKTGEKQFVPSEMLCQYIKDGFTMGAEEYTISSDDLGTKIFRDVVQPQSSAEGWVYYEVPIGADVKLIYDEYITINVPYDNVVMLEK